MLGIIGGGMMGEAIISGILDSHIYSSSQVFVSEPIKERREYLKTKYGINTTENNLEVINNCRIIILAVKPQNIEEVLKEISLNVREDQIYVSIAAGVPLKYLEKYLNRARSIFRIMPNLPLIVKKGIITITSNKYTEEDLKRVKEIFENLGKIWEIPEKYFNIITALTGSGPAFASLILQGFTLAGVKKGLSYDLAKELTLQLFSGIVTLIEEKNYSFEDLIKKTSSPGGTTIMGLEKFYSEGIIGVIMESISKAEERSKEIEEIFKEV
ncbi:MAG: pyrroline-5-carboxylate reductase [Dictyoglomus sp.]|nr:pyrroline-5-carboxylate reductase [Dictyoglomus sp.]MCX7941653.1 pyrroline-5-carboxylate reductase [Dictyoglomaceae bacterium]MDW8188195.1 pyrroline-5-carboxylate reductase [Dictyoglomus sp.]